MTESEAELLRRAAFRDGDECWSCPKCSHERELDVDRPEGDHARYAFFRHCNATSPWQCPAVATLEEVRGYA